MPTSLGPAEVMVILLVALIVLGPEKLPEVGRKVGRALAEVRRWSTGVQQELHGVLDVNLDGDAPVVPPATDAVVPPGSESAAESPAPPSPVPPPPVTPPLFLGPQSSPPGWSPPPPAFYEGELPVVFPGTPPGFYTGEVPAVPASNAAPATAPAEAPTVPASNAAPVTAPGEAPALDLDTELPEVAVETAPAPWGGSRSAESSPSNGSGLSGENGRHPVPEVAGAPEQPHHA